MKIKNPLVESMHLKAMELAALGEEAAMKGQTDSAMEFYSRGFQFEKSVVELTSGVNEDLETHLIFIRSAAALALRAGYFQKAERLIEQALSKKTPVWLEKELKSIQKLILERKKELTEESQNLSISGTLTQINTNENEITVENKLQDKISIIVPMEKIKEIVLKHWQNKVAVKARQTPHGVMVLEDIQAAA